MGRPPSLTASLFHALSQQYAPTVRQPRCWALGPLWEQSRGHSARGLLLAGGDGLMQMPRGGIPPTCLVGTQDGEGGVHAAAQNRKEEEVTPGQRQVQKEAAHPWCHHSLLQPWVPVLVTQLPSPQAPSSRQPLGLPGRSLHRAAWTLCHLYCPQVPSPASRMKRVTSCSPFSWRGPG